MRNSIRIFLTTSAWFLKGRCRFNLCPRNTWLVLKLLRVSSQESDFLNVFTHKHTHSLTDVLSTGGKEGGTKGSFRSMALFGQETAGGVWAQSASRFAGNMLKKV